jgi:hypothetical protein
MFACDGLELLLLVVIPQGRSAKYRKIVSVVKRKVPALTENGEEGSI